jgi:hypothetical protein
MIGTRHCGSLRASIICITESFMLTPHSSSAASAIAFIKTPALALVAILLTGCAMAPGMYFRDARQTTAFGPGAGAAADVPLPAQRRNFHCSATPTPVSLGCLGDANAGFTPVYCIGRNTKVRIDVGCKRGAQFLACRTIENYVTVSTGKARAESSIQCSVGAKALFSFCHA